MGAITVKGAITVADMTEREQIERLVRQRNELWRLIDKFVTNHGDDGCGNGLRSEDRDVEVRVEEKEEEIVIRIANPLKQLSDVRVAAEKLWNECRTIVGNTYLVEGRNPYTGDTLTEEELKDKSFEPYLNDPVKPW